MLEKLVAYSLAQALVRFQLQLLQNFGILLSAEYGDSTLKVKEGKNAYMSITTVQSVGWAGYPARIDESHMEALFIIMPEKVTRLSRKLGN